MNSHAVIVRFHYPQGGRTPLVELEMVLEAAIRQAGVGDFDGNDVPANCGDGYLYFYGPDADAIFDVVRPILEEVPFMTGAVARLRYGPAREGVLERRITLQEPCLNAAVRA